MLVGAAACGHWRLPLTCLRLVTIVTVNRYCSEREPTCRFRLLDWCLNGSSPDIKNLRGLTGHNLVSALKFAPAVDIGH